MLPSAVVLVCSATCDAFCSPPGPGMYPRARCGTISVAVLIRIVGMPAGSNTRSRRKSQYGTPVTRLIITPSMAYPVFE